MLNAAIGKEMAKNTAPTTLETLKPYLATVRNAPRQRVGIMAENGLRAKELLEKRYGKGNVSLIHPIDDPADLPRT